MTHSILHFVAHSYLKGSSGSGKFQAAEWLGEEHTDRHRAVMETGAETVSRDDTYTTIHTTGYLGNVRPTSTTQGGVF